MTVSHEHVSRRLRTEALAGIDAKRSVLALWTRKGIPVRKVEGQPASLEWFPTSLRTFCAWDGTQNSPDVHKKLGELRSNAYQTLVSDSERLNDVKTLLTSLRRHADVVLKRLQPRRALREAEQRVLVEREKRMGALIGYRQARHQARELAKLLAAEKHAHQQTIEQLQRQLHDRDMDIGDLRRQVGELTATLHKTLPMRRVR